MAAPRFIHLRVHSDHSLLEGAIAAARIPALARAEGMPAVALTDSANLFAALEFSVAAAEAGIQPLHGMLLPLDHAPPDPGGRAVPPAPLLVLVQDAQGWQNLLKLASCLYLAPGRAVPAVTPGELARHADGLICLTGGPDGPAGRLMRARQPARAEAHLRALAAAFPGRLYVELQRHPDAAGRLPAAEAETEAGLVDLAYALDLPLVATNDVHFEGPAMYEAHDAMLCIAEGAYVDQAAPRRRLTPEHHFKPAEAMAALFADLPEAVENSVEIARRCAFRARKRAPILPRFADDEVEALRAAAQEGLARRLARGPLAAAPEAYAARLDYELGVIVQMGYQGYFLIVADFIQWAKAQGIPVGPGRGSGAGSLVAWALTITDLDPLRYGLLFERFLNPDRVSMPDFDIDFCMDRRDEVIAYVQRRYGADRVAQIITFGALLSKAAVRDVGRVLQMSYGHVDRIAKLIPLEGVKPVSVARALAGEPRLAEAARAEEVVARLLDYAGQIEGLLRNASTHAAGVVIGDRPLDELVPLYRDPRSAMPATQYNMKWVEAAGLVKFDFLGLKTLTIIQNAVELIDRRGEAVDIAAIPLDDPATYALYASARTVAVFQVESAGMMDALRRMRPTCIEDIVALVALYRPGPMENIPRYCDVKNGLQPRESVHPLIDHLLEETQGIIVYQEQVMQIAQAMAGYTLGEADLLRRAMGKKKPEDMARERPKFVAGALARGVDERKAGEVFDLLEKFANYGFNKSHAAAYALVSYQTAWLKANHPVEFLAAVMNADLHQTDKLAVFAREVRRLGIAILPPCVNRSEAVFSVDGGRIVYALGALRNVGPEAMRAIAAARGGRPFTSLADLARRVDLRRIGRRPLEMLARAGAFDTLEANRRRVFEGLETLVGWSAAVHEAQASAQVSLFGEAGCDLPPPRLPAVADWPVPERLAEEHAAIGFYLTGHPLDDWMPALARRGVITHAEAARRAERGPFLARLAGVVAARRDRKSARGSRYAHVTLSDPSGLYEVTVFSEPLEAARDLLEPGTAVVLAAEAGVEDQALRLTARSVEPVEAVAAAAGAAGLRVHVAAPEAVAAAAALFARLAAEAGQRTRGPVRLCVTDPAGGREYDLEIGRDLPVAPPVRSALKSLPGVVAVEEF
ncbi:MAG: DNA polymerase III subunit alpha [Rhodobacteraceae bacterium]|jgi:DNA polymerase-3 subunit alpha|nr:DNA polymerase III subunit alpha [Paracoccaceae bacterium]